MEYIFAQTLEQIGSFCSNIQQLCWAKVCFLTTSGRSVGNFDRMRRDLRTCR